MTQIILFNGINLNFPLRKRPYYIVQKYFKINYLVRILNGKIHSNQIAII